MRFPASYDLTTKIISGLVCLVLLMAVVAAHSFAIDCLGLLILAACVAYSPRSYVIEGQTILVQRLAGPARVLLQGVRDARRTTPEDLRGCIRLWGSGGLFGYYGLFRTAKLGKSTWYVTNRKNSVVVITAPKTVLFSPDDPDGFLATIRAAAPIQESQGPGSIEPAGSGGSLGMWIAAGVAIVGMSAGVVAYNYSPGVPSYTLTAETLVIHDRLYPVTLHASAVDIRQIRIVDLATDAEWHTTARTNGFGNAHYRSGWFRVANGQKVRLYQADSPIVVLLPPKGEGSPVLYQASDPEKFINDILTAWGASARSSAKAGKWIHYAL
jgi:PH (Pleckstrin Homology) domain-containing protein